VKGAGTAAGSEEPAWFEADQRLREKLASGRLAEGKEPAAGRTDEPDGGHSSNTFMHRMLGDLGRVR